MGGVCAELRYRRRVQLVCVFEFDQIGRPAGSETVHELLACVLGIWPGVARRGEGGGAWGL